MRALAVILALGAPLLAQNEGAKALNEAFSHLQVPDDREFRDHLDDVIEHGWIGDHPDLDDVLAKNEEALSLAAKIAEPEKASFLEGVRVTLETPLPHIEQAKHLATLRVLLARRKAAHGQCDEAAEQCLLALAMAAALDHDRIPIPRLIHSAISQMVAGCLADLVNGGHLSPAEIARIASALAGMRKREPAVADAIAAETEQTIRFVDRLFLDEEALARVLERAEASPNLFEMMKEGDEGLRNQWYDETRTLLEENGRKMAAAATPGHFAEMAVLWKESEAARTTPQGIPDVLFRLLAYEPRRMVDALASHQATLAGIATLVALRRYRDAKGDVPDRLSALVPEFLGEVPCDPFDGKPLRSKNEDGHLLIWSIGRDLTDDGGSKPVDEHDQLPGTDLVWELE